MKLRSELDIQEFLDNEFGWRLREIDYFQTAVSRADGSAQIAMCRGGVALLYAHWEGFVKASAEAYLNFVLNRRLRYKQLRACFIAHGLADHLAILTDSTKHGRRAESVAYILATIEQTARFPWKGVVQAEGNLNAEVFRNIAAAIALDASRYETRFTWIDEKLLRVRNQIAHGEQTEVAPKDFPTLTAETLTLLRWFKTDLENSIAMKTYMTGT